jgi:opacity protein-like surface antigen
MKSTVLAAALLSAVAVAATAATEATAAGDYDHGASGDVYHQTFDADADGTGAACSEWGGHEFSCGALGGICTNDHEDHHDHHDEDHSWTRGALSKTFAVRAGSYNVKLDFIQIDDMWDANVARVKVNGVVCWTQDFTVIDYGEGVTPGGLAQCKLDYKTKFGKYCPEGDCKWYVARLIERESL